MRGACHGSYHQNVITVLQVRHNYPIACKSKTTYCMHLGPSPFDSAPRTLLDTKFHFLVNFPFNILAVRIRNIGRCVKMVI